MKSIKDYARERELKQTGGHPESAAFHSRNYRRHFEGWSEVKEKGEDGRVRTRRVYTGVYHRARLSDRQSRLLRAAYALLWLAAAALFLFAATRPTPSNTVVYVTALQGLCVALLGWLMWALYNYVTAGRNMTLGEYHYVGMVKRAALCSAAALGLTALGTLAYRLIHPDGQLLCAALFLLGALCCLGIRLAESRVAYDSFLSDREPPEDSTQISL